MKLNEFSPLNCGRLQRTSKKAIISFSVKNGNFRINKSACGLLEVEEGNQIVFHQDEETGEWYVENVKEGGFVLGYNPRVSGGLYFCNTYLARQISDSVDFTGTSGKCELSEQSTDDGRKIFFMDTNDLVSE